jgi:hypothetical protein
MFEAMKALKKLTVQRVKVFRDQLIWNVEDNYRDFLSSFLRKLFLNWKSLCSERKEKSFRLPFELSNVLSKY